MDILDIFRERGRTLFWSRFDDTHIADGPESDLIAPDEDYVIVRLTRMYLSHTRKLWRKFYPVVHGFTSYQGAEDHAIIGPGQLADLGTANLERVMVLNQRLTGPTPYRGGDLSLTFGLYSVPGDDLSASFLTTIGAVAGLGIALGNAPEIARIVKAGVGSLVGLDQERLRLGVRDEFYQSNPLRSGYYLGVSSRDVDPQRLWLRKGDLVEGSSPPAGRPYEQYDYLVVQVEKLEQRADWPMLSGMGELEKRFAAIFADAKLDTHGKSKALEKLWPEVQSTLDTSSQLTKRDRARIAGDIEGDLKTRLGRKNPFETKGVSSKRGADAAKAPFDLAEVEAYVDISDAASLAMGRLALESNPFTAP